MHSGFPIERLNCTKLNKVVFTSDLLRVDNLSLDRIPNPQRTNVEWLYQLIWPKIQRVTSSHNFPWEPERLLGDELGWQSLRVKFFKTISHEMSAENWARLYSGENYYEELSSAMSGLFDGALVIGFELPPYLIKYLNQHSIPYIGLHIHPVRFLPDVMFGLTTNVSSLEKYLSKLIIPDNFIYEHADLIRARSTRVLDDSLRDNSVLFLGQSSVDASLIYDDRLIGFDDLEAGLIKLCFENETVYYKKHPYLGKHAEKKISALVERIGNCHWIDANMYDLFGSRAIKSVAAMSSGGLIEAKYFGKQIIRLLGTDNLNKGHPVYEYPLATAFWEDLLTEKLDEIEKYNYYFQNDLLRSSLNIYWGK